MIFAKKKWDSFSGSFRTFEGYLKTRKSDALNEQRIIHPESIDAIIPDAMID